jgi:hypothetical protein
MTAKHSSFLFIANVAVGLLTQNYIYSALFATLFLTSIEVHTNNYLAINLLDKFVIFLVFLYGGFRLYEKHETSWWGTAKSCIILSTCLYVIWSYCYGYLTTDLCFYPNEEIATIYHMLMHLVGSLGHNMIMLY